MLMNPYFDPNYLLFVGPAILLAMFTSWYVRHAYNKWSQVRALSGLSGAEAAQRLITNGGLQGVSIQVIGGELSDNYDPRAKVLNLSAGVARSNSVAAIAIAAHELGHALQDAENLCLEAVLFGRVIADSGLAALLRCGKGNQRKHQYR